MYCCTPKALYNHVGGWGGGVSPQPPPVCSIHLDYATAATGTTAPVRSPHTGYRWRRERVIEPIKCMRSPHTSYRWRGERAHRANQVYALTTHQLQVERRESHRANQVDALTTHQLQVERRESHRANQVYALTTHSYRWRGESHRANQVDALAKTKQLQVERRESIDSLLSCMRSPHTSYRRRGERIIEPINWSALATHS